MSPDIDAHKELLQEKILLQDLSDEQESYIKKLNSKNTDADRLSHEINELRQEKILRDETEPSVSSNNNKLKIIGALAGIALFSGLFFILFDADSQESGLSSGYIIQNLKGDTIDTWLSWQIPPEKTLYVNVISNSHLTDTKFNIIKSVIDSDETIEIDDNLLHKGPPGSTSTYYLAWSGALNSLSSHTTKYTIPQKLEVVSDPNPTGDIVIQLTDTTNGDGFSGFTKSIADDSQNQILKATITIYDIDKISDGELETLVRHEMGHALGLAHSTAPEDLMHPVILTDYPYISDCDLDAILNLYDGKKQSKVVCES